jgi:hypothetical protein
MGFSLSSIVSDVASLATDPGKLAKDVCDAVLPQNMKAIGDIVGGAVDYETGHPLQALGHLADALKDLPQMAQGLSSSAKTNVAAAPAGSLAAEPAPPPPRAPGTQPAVANTTAPPGTSQTSTTSGPQPAATNGTARGSTRAAHRTATEPAHHRATMRWGGRHREVVRTRASAPAPAASAPAGSAPAASAPAASAPAASGASTSATSSKAAAGSTGANGAGGTTTSGASKSASSSEDAADSSASTSESKGSTATPSSLSDLMALSPDQFMQAVTSGKIPPDVANNPSAMTQIQARMNQITQMNQLVTSMMAAMHQMQMAIIQNIRV